MNYDCHRSRAESGLQVTRSTTVSTLSSPSQQNLPTTGKKKLQLVLDKNHESTGVHVHQQHTYKLHHAVAINLVSSTSFDVVVVDCHFIPDSLHESFDTANPTS
ncbi:Uncharacterized protein TCM_015112 [Theobroma cacao]|uniref:Uncharacterized protein n=1 Tax=Theobroma cacao TaxID=3641 RepID=A0A061FZY5_THECC|nr:Uncharacterized protein TCM_015112 [Theobroma cacao]